MTLRLVDFMILRLVDRMEAWWMLIVGLMTNRAYALVEAVLRTSGADIFGFPILLFRFVFFLLSIMVSPLPLLLLL